MTDIQDEIDALSERIRQLEGQDTASELRFRRLWKNDIDAAYRSQIQDILLHVDSKVAELLHEPLQKASDDVRKALDEQTSKATEHLSRNDLSIEERFSDLKKHLEHQVAAIVIGLFREYRVLDHRGKPIGEE